MALPPIVEEKYLWRGRHVCLVDGSTVSMPDTQEHQAAYPQLGSQRKGLGFPAARIVVLLSLATGMITNMAMGPYHGKKTGETALLRQLFGRFRPGDILLGDRYFCSYFMLALLMELKIDFVTRIHQLRWVDFRSGRRLGKGDHIARWERPQKLARFSACQPFCRTRSRPSIKVECPLFFLVVCVDGAAGTFIQNRPLVDPKRTVAITTHEDVGCLVVLSNHVLPIVVILQVRNHRIQSLIELSPSACHTPQSVVLAEAGRSSEQRPRTPVRGSAPALSLLYTGQTRVQYEHPTTASRA